MGVVEGDKAVRPDRYTHLRSMSGGRCTCGNIERVDPGGAGVHVPDQAGLSCKIADGDGSVNHAD